MRCLQPGLLHAVACCGFCLRKTRLFSCALKRTTGLAARMLASCRMLRLLLAQNPFIYMCTKAHDRACSPFPFQFIVLEAFIHFIRYVVIQRLMKPRCVIEVEVGIYDSLQVFHCFIAFHASAYIERRWNYLLCL